MHLFAPLYYADFRCIADKCRHSCCIGWEIDIDENTLAEYESVRGGYGDRINESIERGECPHFALIDNRCPHLDKSGLCNIITELGEEWLCDICREHPRFYNDTPHGREVGLGMSCEEAARIILEYENYAETSKICDVDDVGMTFEFDTVAERARIYKKLSDTEIPYGERIVSLWNEYGASPKILTDDEWRGVVSELEYLRDGHRELFACYSSEEETPEEYEKILERFLAYLIYRHATPKETKSQFRTALGFAFFTERLLASLYKCMKLQNKNDMYELARVVSEEIEYSEDNTEAIAFEFEFQ